MKGTVKRLVGPPWQARARRISRLRWITKFGILRSSDVAVLDDPRRNLAFVLWDPEVESYTYDVANLDEMAAFISEATGEALEVVRSYLAEPAVDPVFNGLWAQRMRWRFDAKRRLMLGNRHLWWGFARTLKPRLVVETGIYNGIGSTVILRALQRNADDGAQGELVSIDADPTAGSMVPVDLREHWSRIVGVTSDILDGTLEDRQISLFIHDTLHTLETQTMEFSTALNHAAEKLVILDAGGGQTGALREVCAMHGGAYRHFREEPVNHFYAPAGTGVGIFPAPN